MKRLISLLLPIFIIGGCTVVKYVPIQGETIVKETIKDTTIYVEVPKEVVKEVVPELDTLLLETSMATSKSYLDTTTRTLKGILTNKPQKIAKEIQYVVRDTTIYKEVPVEVEVVKYEYPTSYWIFLGITVLSVIMLIIRIYLKIKL